MSRDETFLVLGGGGMIGAQIVRQIARHLAPRRIVVVSLYQREVREAIEQFEREFPTVHFVGFWGNVFWRTEWNTQDRQRQMNRTHLLESEERRTALYDDLFGDIETAYEHSQLVQLILEHRPDVVVDGINTATAISYQDVYEASETTRERWSDLMEQATTEGAAPPGALRAMQQALDTLLISQSVPQLIRHIFLISRAMSEVGTRLYLKVGTTGTGGMGLNIPYTHSEDKPSAKLMTKTAIAFAHTGLLFLMARTVNGPVVKELKPGAMVGYTNITCQTIRRRGNPVLVYAPRAEPLGDTLCLSRSASDFESLGKLEMVVVDTGENGLFAKGEFETITHLRQMEFITPEEIAQQAVLEIRGRNTGHDVISAIDGSVMNPTYRAGVLRHFALDEIERLEEETGLHSVALGDLGPPELSKLLWEAHLLKLRFGTLTEVLAHPAEDLATELFELVQRDEALVRMMTAIGLPILTPDGQTLLRGPLIRIPEQTGSAPVRLTPEHIEQWANKGWVDLRPQNFEHWRSRFRAMQRESQRLRGHGSAAVTRQAYLSDTISIGAVVGWIFNNEKDASGQEKYGYRIK